MGHLQPFCIWQRHRLACQFFSIHSLTFVPSHAREDVSELFESVHLQRLVLTILISCQKRGRIVAPRSIIPSGFSDWAQPACRTCITSLLKPSLQGQFLLLPYFENAGITILSPRFSVDKKLDLLTISGTSRRPDGHIAG